MDRPSQVVSEVGLRHLLGPHAGVLAVAVALNAAHGIAIAFQNLLPKYLIDDVILVEATPAQRWERTVVLVGLYLVVSVIGRMMLWHLSYRIFTRVRERVIFALRRAFFRHVNALCLRFHRSTDSGELFTYLFGSPLAVINSYYNHATMTIPGAVFGFMMTLGWVAMWDWMMTLVLGASVLATVLIMQVARKRIHALQTEFQEVEGEVSGRVVDLLRGTRDVKLFSVEDRVVEDFSARVRRVGAKVYERDVRTHQQYMKNEAAGYVGFAAIIALGVWRYTSGVITLGEFQAYLTAFIALQGPLNAVFTLFASRGAAQAGMQRIESVLRTSSSTPEPAGVPVEVPQRAAIAMRGVTFGFDKGEPVLRGVDLEIPYGQHVAIAGPSGSGKSTLSQLLLRLYDPQEGAVEFGGVDLRRMSSAALRRAFGVVPQDPFIFRTTLRENLRVAMPDATDEQLVEACRRANIWSFIERLPAGLDTSVGEGGATLSGGQKQRLAIARAMLKDPDYYIFDEATSALDSVSEGAIQDVIEHSCAGRTTVVIAHRLATVRRCDRVLVLDAGRIVQDGTYEELTAQPGLFRVLVQSQQLLAA